MKDINGTVVIVGNYGSGKTEVSVNLAIQRKQAGVDVCLADLDLVNPYFRAREAKDRLAAMGIDVILPPERYLNADLPILDASVSGAILRGDRLLLLDVGGDEVGATVLSSLADVLSVHPVQMFQMVNPFRPFTETIEGCEDIRRRIENAARISMTGIIGNANLMDETTPEHVYEGYDFLKKLSEESGLPLKFITVPAPLSTRVDTDRFACPVLLIHRQLVPPWRKTNALNIQSAAKKSGQVFNNQ
jgi:hypothetical protein